MRTEKRNMTHKTHTYGDKKGNLANPRKFTFLIQISLYDLLRYLGEKKGIIPAISYAIYVNRHLIRVCEGNEL